MLKQQFSLLFRKKAFYIAFAVFFIFNMYAALTEVLEIFQRHQFDLQAGESSVLDYAYITSAATHTVLSALMFNAFITVSIALILCSVSYSDSFFSERKTGVVQILLTKTKRSYYYVSKLIVTFTANLIVFFIPLAANQLVLFSFFRKDSIAGLSGGSMHTYNDFLQLNMAFNPNLIDKHPYVYNVICFAIFAVFMGLISCAVVCLSYYVRRYRVILLVAPLMLNIVLRLFDALLDIFYQANIFKEMPVWFSFENYLAIYERGTYDSPWFFALLCAALPAFIVFSTRSQCKRDVL